MLNNPVIQGTKLPALSNPGTAADLLAGKQLIDQYGNIVTGTASKTQPVHWYCYPSSLTSTKAVFAANTSLLTAGIIYIVSSYPTFDEPPTLKKLSSGYSVTTGTKYLYQALLYHRDFQGESQWGYQLCNGFSYDSSGDLKWEFVSSGYPVSQSNDLQFELSSNGTLTLTTQNGLNFLLSASGNVLSSLMIHYDYIP